MAVRHPKIFAYVELKYSGGLFGFFGTTLDRSAGAHFTACNVNRSGSVAQTFQL
jgi:hypothetical protein